MPTEKNSHENNTVRGYHADSKNLIVSPSQTLSSWTVSEVISGSRQEPRFVIVVVVVVVVAGADDDDRSTVHGRLCLVCVVQTNNCHRLATIVDKQTRVSNDVTVCSRGRRPHQSSVNHVTAESATVEVRLYWPSTTPAPTTSAESFGAASLPHSMLKYQGQSFRQAVFRAIKLCKLIEQCATGVTNTVTRQNRERQNRERQNRDHLTGHFREHLLQN